MNRQAAKPGVPESQYSIFGHQGPRCPILRLPWPINHPPAVVPRGVVVPLGDLNLNEVFKKSPRIMRCQRPLWPVLAATVAVAVAGADSHNNDDDDDHGAPTMPPDEPVAPALPPPASAKVWDQSLLNGGHKATCPPGKFLDPSAATRAECQHCQTGMYSRVDNRRSDVPQNMGRSFYCAKCPAPSVCKRLRSKHTCFDVCKNIQPVTPSPTPKVVVRAPPAPVAPPVIEPTPVPTQLPTTAPTPPPPTAQPTTNSAETASHLWKHTNSHHATGGCKMGSWSPFSPCSRTCGGGTRRRQRKILSKGVFGVECDRNAIQDKLCNTNRCPRLTPDEYTAAPTPVLTFALTSVTPSFPPTPKALYAHGMKALPPPTNLPTTFVTHGKPSPAPTVYAHGMEPLPPLKKKKTVGQSPLESRMNQIDVLEQIYHQLKHATFSLPPKDVMVGMPTAGFEMWQKQVSQASQQTSASLLSQPRISKHSRNIPELTGFMQPEHTVPTLTGHAPEDDDGMNVKGMGHSSEAGHAKTDDDGSPRKRGRFRARSNGRQDGSGSVANYLVSEQEQQEKKWGAEQAQEHKQQKELIHQLKEVEQANTQLQNKRM